MNWTCGQANKGTKIPHYPSLSITTQQYQTISHIESNFGWLIIRLNITPYVGVIHQTTNTFQRTQVVIVTEMFTSAGVPDENFLKKS